MGSRGLSSRLLLRRHEGVRSAATPAERICVNLTIWKLFLAAKKRKRHKSPNGDMNVDLGEFPGGDRIFCPQKASDRFCAFCAFLRQTFLCISLNFLN